MHEVRHPKYKDAFSYALRTVAMIESAPLMVNALIEIGTLLSNINRQSALRVFESAYEAITKMPQPLKDEFLYSLVKRLVKADAIDTAFKYSLELDDEIKKNDVLILILNSYVDKGNLRKAHEVLDYIQSEPWRSLALFNILREHLKREEFGTTLGLLSQFRSDYWLGEAVKTAAFYLKKAGVWDSAVYEKFLDVLIELLPKMGAEVLRSFLIGLALQNDVEFVAKSLPRIPREYRDEVLPGIVSSIIDMPELLERFIDLLPEDARELVEAQILDYLLEAEPKSEYLSLVRKIGSMASSDRILVKVIRYLSKLHDYETAWELASSIKDPHLRSLAFGGIAVEKLKEGDIDGAIDATSEVKDPRWGSWLLSEILAKIAELQASGRVVEDIEERAEEQKRLWAKE
ncbi:hypothetical protein [Thermococcus stetteri]|uniref:hypothetical protein n=1 Tax=Thermococcus stetteri TaxID=49900 RepID=UPI001AEA7CC0|nr:hypothetical protein [Thermococcus stetteri]MBP1911933.1 hypothetical protein [Thermococcus stetteri]